MPYYVETDPCPSFKWLVRWKLYPVCAAGYMVDEDGDTHLAIGLVDRKSFLVDL